MITNITSSFSPVLTQNCKVLALETSLQQSLLNFRELLTDFEQLHIESDNYKSWFKTQKENCQSKLCSGAEELKKVIQQKDDVIQLAASTLVRLSETKNWSNLEEVFKILFGETKTEPNEDIVKHEDITKVVSVKNEPVSLVEKVLETSLEDVSFTDESISEIEGTPTGRCSPIIQTKKFRSYVVTTLDKTKKKNLDLGVSTDNKELKLLFTPTQNKKCRNLRQSRLSVVKVPTKNIIDITSSPAFSGGCRGNNDDTECYAQKIIKKEVVENDDTILPSPTSGPTDFTLFKSPMKFKKPPLKLKSKSDIPTNIFMKLDKDTEKKIIKTERKGPNGETHIDVKDRENCNSVTYTQDDSINILHPDRLFKNLKNSPSKQKQYENANSSPTKTNLNKNKFHDTDSSISLLHHVNKLEDINKNDNMSSPSKHPLAENINVTNITEEEELQASMSLLPRDAKLRLADDNGKRRLVEPVEVYHGTTPRTRAEKRQLPGWACEKCINFFSELHKDNPDMMWKKINECSHHRGVNNPERPKTPPGYWNPRWNVPDDTEEFNKRNNV